MCAGFVVFITPSSKCIHPIVYVCVCAFFRRLIGIVVVAHAHVQSVLLPPQQHTAATILHIWPTCVNQQTIEQHCHHTRLHLLRLCTHTHSSCLSWRDFSLLSTVTYLVRYEKALMLSLCYAVCGTCVKVRRYHELPTNCEFRQSLYEMYWPVLNQNIFKSQFTK